MCVCVRERKRERERERERFFLIINSIYLDVEAILCAQSNDARNIFPRLL